MKTMKKFASLGLTGLLLAAVSMCEAGRIQEKDKRLHSGGSPWGVRRAEASEDRPFRVLLIGDSIMNGYRHGVTELLADIAVCDTWATPAHLNSPGLREKLTGVVSGSTYDLVHFNIGLHGWVEGRIPEGQYEPLLRAYVAAMEENAGGARLIWCSSTPIMTGEKPRELDPVNNPTMVERNDIAARVMHARDIRINDLYSTMVDKLPLGIDKFHWAAGGKRLQAAQIAHFIRNELQPAGHTLFVSPQGNDADPGTREKPFATLTRAREEVRKLIPEGRSITVNLRDGEYLLGKTLVLGLEDSALPGMSITWQGYEDETAVLSSGVRMTGWKRAASVPEGLPAAAKGKLWVADLPAGIERPLSLYQGDRMLSRARTKGFTPATDYHPRDNPPKGALDRQTLHFPEGAVKDWENLEDVELLIIPSFPWWMNILSFESVDTEKRTARTTIPATDYLCPMVNYARRGFPLTAWIENVPEGLDEPGEWMVNSRTREIYYWPTGGEPGDDIHAPALRELIRVEGINDPTGDADRPVTGLHFKKLAFTRADRGVWNAEDAGIQHDWEMLDRDNAMLRFRGAKDCSVRQCRFFNAAGNAIRMDLYGQQINVENSLFTGLGQSAVMMIGYGPGTKDVNRNNRVVNNHIHHCGLIYWHSQMITAFQSGGNYIAHNHVHDVPRKAICISGVREHWLPETGRRECVDTIRRDEIGEAANHEELLPFLHARNNIIEYNDVHDVLQMLGDGAAINLSGSGVGNVVRYNYVHDIPAKHVTSGIRMDEDQTHTLIEKNIIVNLGVAGITPKQANTIRNNFIIQTCNAGNMGMIRAYGGGNGGLSHIERNILYNLHPGCGFYTRYNLDYDTGQLARVHFDNNLYFCPGTGEADWPGLAAFKSKGFDAHSLFADPLFADWQNRDFRLLPESPALKLGIEPIDISSAGLTDAFPAEWR